MPSLTNQMNCFFYPKAYTSQFGDWLRNSVQPTPSIVPPIPEFRCLSPNCPQVISAIFVLVIVTTPSSLSAATITPSAPSSVTTTFAVLPADPGPWQQILSSVSFQPQTADSADILVLRPGATAPAHLTERVEQRCIS